MLLIAKNMREFSFSSLMAVYEEGNRENGEEFWPHEPSWRQMALAEQDFFDYLSQVFFSVPGAVYCILEENGKYVSALRLEPYRDGLLLEALETAPEERKKGYACALVEEVLSLLKERGGAKLYSHVGKRNAASLAVHEKCGFRRILELAVYADGSVNERCCTMLFEV